MTRDTLERILAERKAKKEKAGYSLPEGEVATLLLGTGPIHPIPGVVRFSPGDAVLVVCTRKGADTYLQYEAIQAVTFEPKELADRRTGF
jgi:hypothetical protein